VARFIVNTPTSFLTLLSRRIASWRSVSILGLALLLPQGARATVTYTGPYQTGATYPYNLVLGTDKSGVTGAATLTLSGGASLSANNNAFIGPDVGSSGILTVDGSSTMYVYGNLYTGIDGTITGGGGAIYVKNSSRIYVLGSDVNLLEGTSTPILDISGGSSLSASGGFQTNAVTISVDGSHSSLSTGFNLFPKLNTTASLSITNGATATLSSLYAQDNGATAITVSGTGSKLTMTGSSLQVGGNNSTLTISGGAQVTTKGILLSAASSGATTTLSLSGAGTLWTSTDKVTLNSAAITIKDGAQLKIQGSYLQLAPDTGTATGTLKIGDGSAPGTLNATSVLGGYSSNATAIVDFNHTSSSYYFTTDGTSSGTAVAILGITQVVVDAGTTTLNSTSNSYTGGTQINGGTLIVGSNAALGTGSVKVSGGTLQISKGSSITNTVTLAGGNLTQGVAAGTQLSTLRVYNGLLVNGVATEARFLGGQTSADALITGGFHLDSVAHNDANRISDIFSLSGLTVLDGATGQTDTFVLQLKLDSVTDNSLLAWLDPNTQTWVNAIAGNIGGSAHFVLGAYNAATDNQLGTYGVDTDNGTVWAVLDHNSDFAILNSPAAAPEPSTWLLFALGLAGVVFYRRQNSR
jgi:autotransporter-associated beta strand protein/T5SS/PEP-CTERM-associated repeat protein